MAEEKLQNDDTQKISQNTHATHIIEINTVDNGIKLLARLTSGVILHSEQAFLSDIKYPKIEKHIYALLRGTLPQYYHLRH